MNNTIPFHSATHAPQITVDVNILSMLKQAASCLSEMASENVYLAAIGPDMELTIIVEMDPVHIFPINRDKENAVISRLFSMFSINLVQAKSSKNKGF